MKSKYVDMAYTSMWPFILGLKNKQTIPFIVGVCLKLIIEHFNSFLAT